MAVKGEFPFRESGGNVHQLKWEIVQWHSSSQDRTHGRPANVERMPFGDTEWVRVLVTDPDLPKGDYGRYVTFYGPFGDIKDQINGELEAMWDMGDYSVASLS